VVAQTRSLWIRSEMPQLCHSEEITCKLKAIPSQKSPYGKRKSSPRISLTGGKCLDLQQSHDTIEFATEKSEVNIRIAL
jgi:hypothetical protein